MAELAKQGLAELEGLCSWGVRVSSKLAELGPLAELVEGELRWSRERALK